MVRGQYGATNITALQHLFLHIPADLLLQFLLINQFGMLQSSCNGRNLATDGGNAMLTRVYHIIQVMRAG
ncbi:hypothetical protein A2U01_0087175, partial [Trifolium medium]|nr:hypothetical protein [Trifolium medium]